MELLDRYDVSPERAWVTAFVAIVVTVAAAALAFPRQVYDGFIWRYFLGPVRVDATEANCLVYFRDSGEIVSGADAQGCAPAAYENAFVVTDGYTVTSTLGYILVLIFMIAGVYLLLDRFDLRPYRNFFYALVPFMLFGGALRTVEDAFVAALRAPEATPGLEYPASALLISPFIYFTVFAIALAAFLASKLLAHREITETYTYPLGIMGVGWLAISFGYLLFVSVTQAYATLYPSFLVVVLGLATVLSVLAYVAVEKYWPWINAGTGLVGLVVIWGHAVDGVANVLANDWTHLWHGADYGAKHPFNQFVMNTTSSIQGGEYVAGIYVGDAWPFLLVKILAPVLILAVFDEEFVEDSPRFSILLLGAVLAVGLGPGTRDMLRVAFGI